MSERASVPSFTCDSTSASLVRISFAQWSTIVAVAWPLRGMIQNTQGRGKLVDLVAFVSNSVRASQCAELLDRC